MSLALTGTFERLLIISNITGLVVYAMVALAAPSGDGLTSELTCSYQNCFRPGSGDRGNKGIWASSKSASRLPFALPVNPPHEMDCPECATHVAPMAGSTWAIAWYSCGQCGTFWYARLRVGPGADAIPSRRMLASPVKASTNESWTLEELEAEADALRRESDCLPKGNLEALRLHLEKLKVLADAINHRLDSRATLSTGTP